MKNFGKKYDLFLFELKVRLWSIENKIRAFLFLNSMEKMENLEKFGFWKIFKINAIKAFSNLSLISIWNYGYFKRNTLCVFALVVFDKLQIPGIVIIWFKHFDTEFGTNVAPRFKLQLEHKKKVSNLFVNSVLKLFFYFLRTNDKVVINWDFLIRNRILKNTQIFSAK